MNRNILNRMPELNAVYDTMARGSIAHMPLDVSIVAAVHVAAIRLDVPPMTYNCLKNAYNYGGSLAVTDLASMASITGTTALLAAHYGLENHLSCRRVPKSTVQVFPRLEEPSATRPIGAYLRPYAWAMTELMASKHSVLPGQLLQHGIRILCALGEGSRRGRRWQIRATDGRSANLSVQNLLVAANLTSGNMPPLNTTPVPGPVPASYKGYIL